jgi:hypothetical protein
VGPRHTVQRGPPQRGLADYEQHLLRREQDGPQVPSEGGGATGHAVDLDLLAAADLEGQFEGHAGAFKCGRRRGRRARPGRGLTTPVEFGDGCPTDNPVEPHEIGTPSDQFGIGRSPVGSPQRQQDDGLEQGRLAGRVGTPDQLRPGPELGVQRGVAPEVPDRQ